MSYLRALAVGGVTALAAGTLAVVIQVFAVIASDYFQRDAGTGMGAMTSAHVSVPALPFLLASLLGFAVGVRRSLRARQHLH